VYALPPFKKCTHLPFQEVYALPLSRSECTSPFQVVYALPPFVQVANFRYVAHDMNIHRTTASPCSEHS